ncbi:MAG: prolyl oligopeptidase family serine peptidase [Gammaproteobacteria bacterium]|nr:prolyl oligopeptidase family serine peptidase [Gammaproteobacteria bacterium]MBU2056392.1 prolyl oligopeptidase family serine peptidase [Gammaproteobacteria bacterium]MBU2177285.1 prolyl oligopeptidase family serine peptidase [Gammaproteobacteria bacterium]MBU2246187.1 prolyl oligopeptidase family serine peptidase [Gammaproteobacteria bacterium]MBU2343035.1 prolyl oligopeptidase family serine peptidase [Gammaproteobacteria bacterium]
MKLFWFVLLLGYSAQSTALSWPGFAKQQSCLELYPTYQQLVDEVRTFTPWYSMDHWLMPWLLPKDQFDVTQHQLHCAQLEYQSDNLMVQAWGLQPHSKSTKKWPVIIYNRGGNAALGRLDFVSVLRQLSPLAQQGFIVLASQYRGSVPQDQSTYGKDQFGGDDVNDIHQLIELAKQLPEADANNIFLYGISRGGMMSYLTARQRDDIRAMAITAAPTDLVTELPRLPEMELIFRSLIPNYDQNKQQALQQRSVLYWAEELPAGLPILLMYGGEDQRVHPENSQRLAAKLTELQRQVKLIEFTGADHLLTDYKAQEREAMLQWFRQHQQNEQKAATAP